MKRTPLHVLLIAAGNAAAVIVALAVLAWFTVGRERKQLEQRLAQNEPIAVIPFDMQTPGLPAVEPFDTNTSPATLPLASPPIDEGAPLIVRELARFEQQGDYTAALRATLRDSASLSQADREELITWLTSRKESAAFPTLFMLARTHQDAGRSEEAAKWYMAGSLVGLIDAARFEDSTAGDAVREIEAQFSDIRQRLRQDSALRVQAVSFALEMESQLSQRPAPVWIASRAQSAVAGEPAKVRSSAEWDAQRKAYRDLFTGFLERSGKMSVVELGWAFE